MACLSPSCPQDSLENPTPFPRRGSRLYLPIHPSQVGLTPRSCPTTEADLELSYQVFIPLLNAFAIPCHDSVPKLNPALQGYLNGRANDEGRLMSAFTDSPWGGSR